MSEGIEWECVLSVLTLPEEERGTEAPEKSFLCPSHPKESKMHMVDEYDEPGEWRSQKDHQMFQETLIKTRGLHSHFWLESHFVDLDGEVRRLTEYRKNKFLQKLTKIVNLREVEQEWPMIDWEEVVHKNSRVRHLAEKLKGLCSPELTCMLEDALNVVEIPVNPVLAPYLRRNLESPCPENIAGATILKNVRLRLSATRREVTWTSRVLYNTDAAGNTLPMFVTGRTLRRLFVTIEIKSEPHYIQHLWVEVHKDPERAEIAQRETLRSLLK